MVVLFNDHRWKGEAMKRIAAAGAISAMLMIAASSIATAQNVRSEAAQHPRIATAIRELEEAIRYMEAAPHDFGGHKAAAIRDSRAALGQLRAALAYRAKADR
jgi:hypothetical protein